MTETFTIERTRYTPTDKRLGRHVNHDSRSLRYLVEASDVNTLKSIRHERYIPILDQGSLGSCTGNAATGCLGTGEFWATVQDEEALSNSDAVVDEKYAVGVYSEATAIDPFAGTYPPTDTGSDGLSVAKVLQKRGLISGYQHATSFEAALTALATQPVIVGTLWLTDMFHPATDGHLHLTGSRAGAHEYVLDELDMENERVWMANSWSTGWGVRGRAYFSFDDFKKLLSLQGDCTVFTPVTEPAPTPTPPAPPAPPTPDPDAEFKQAAEAFKAALDKYLSRS